MEDSRSMTDYPPEFPDVDPAVLANIVAYAESTVAWLEMDQLVASQHGHDPQGNAGLIAGWRFVAEALAEEMDVDG